MKMTNRRLKILGWIIFLAGAVTAIVFRIYQNNHPEETVGFLKWLGVVIMILAMFLLMPWIRKDEEK
jgi:hypothetical protein